MGCFKMSVFVETLKRLYVNKKVTKSKIDNLLKEKKLNKSEYDYILDV